MDHLKTELSRHQTKLNKPLQAMKNALIARCNEAKNLKSKITIAQNTGSPPTAELESIITRAAQTFLEKVRTLRQAEQGKKTFCTTHNLTDTNINPNPVVTILLITICVFLDAGVNGSFLYNAHMVTGPFAALLVSFLISLTNVVLSVCGGYFIGRYLNYGNNCADAEAQEFKTVRDRAKWQFRTFIGVMGFYLLTVGLVRSTESLDKIGHSLAHYHELIVTPEAVFLVLLNLCIAIYSYHKGRTGFAHPYGGFGPYQKSVATAQDDLNESYEDAAEAIENACDAVEDAAEAQEKAQKGPIKLYNKEATKCHDAYRDLGEAVRTAANEFSATATRIVNTQSVLTGKSIAIPDDLLDQFTFVDVSDIELPDSYQPSQRNQSNPALTKAKAAALKRLNDVFKHALQS